jgi:hypothetical protein
MAIECRFLQASDAYERTVSAWVDRAEGALLELHARLSDGEVDLEVGLVAEPSPSYQLSRAWATPHSDATRRTCGALVEAYRDVGRLRIVAGFRREVAGLLGDRPGADHLLDATLEAARLSRQVTQTDLPASPRLGPAEFHQLDLEAWPELVDLCFTYRRESAPLFTERPVRTPAIAAMYAGPPGQKLAFHRYKRSRLERAGPGFSLYQSMFDQVHGFELWYEVDAPSQEIVGARALTPRLPYMGICDEPQRRVREMVGVTLDADWPAAVRSRLGGRQGCFQLTDLTSDIFRLLNPT